ncbi:zinc transporter ZIP10 isoform X2 [Lingula anatina]|uniref:Zinc transporter ZIP10 isoform X2 n=1 Tax=Lingula anatina TaxID=7574 RepID=A0A1S3J1A2_LINAN|nr:zinc transporter ZIP10 isoform X2 [Lingula anatina]|eukprot:XP_013404220.1 zinc transporter ZIP10 isoform X2 [Lingula anatina]
MKSTNTQARICIYLFLLTGFLSQAWCDRTKIANNQSDHVDGETHIFLKRIFDKYGTDGLLTYEGFEHLLANLGLGNIFIDHDLKSHQTDKGFKNLHSSHNHTHDGSSTTRKVHSPLKSASLKRGTLEKVAQKELEEVDRDVTAENQRGNREKPRDHMVTRRKHQHHHKSNHKHNRQHDRVRNRKPEGSPALHNGTTTRTEGTERSRSGRQLRSVGSVDRRVRAINDTQLAPTTTRPGPAEQPSEGLSWCLTPAAILAAFKVQDAPNITEALFMRICPALVYQLDSHLCQNRIIQAHDHEYKHEQDDYYWLYEDFDDHIHGNDSVTKVAIAGDDRSARVWGFASLSVIVISLVGLLGVCVVPLMQKIFYNHLLQFLVALAVGSLTGDALLHLLPHALGSHGNDMETQDDGHNHGGPDTKQDPNRAVWKGIVALLGIYFFFLCERLMSLYSSHKAKQKKKRREMEEERLAELAQKEMNVLPELKVEGDSEEPVVPKPAHEHHLTVEIARPRADSMFSYLTRPRAESSVSKRSYRPPAKDSSLSDSKKTNNSCEDVLMMHNKAMAELADEARYEWEDMEAAAAENEAEEESLEMTKMGEGKEGEHGHGHSHGKKHGHGHGHDHGMPTSVASVAWMVIMGDGLHNFSDGLAIGAAFGNSMTGGLSTSIAVFCHELPHELGDFAMLLRAGMSVKQALVYNGVSSILCFIGMLIGIAAGNMGGASLWIFALAGGMFMYIALVDMLPELANVQERTHENQYCHLLIQSAGMMVGIGIMMTIALYEDQIKVDAS